MLGKSAATYKTLSVLIGGVFMILLIGFFAFTYQSEEVGTAAVEDIDCSSLGQDKRSACFLDEIVAMSDNSGITAATTYLSQVTSEFPELQNDCHAVMHVLGEAGYYAYANGERFEVTSQITYCTYGFYHGFITEAVTSEGSFDIARDFCAYVNEELSKQGFEVESECYHGFGHAAVDDHISTQFLTATEVTNNALKLCDEVSETFMQYRNCASGIYNGVANIYMDGTYEWPEIQEENKLRICEIQEEQLQQTCFGYFARVLVSLNESNLKAALDDAMTISVPESRLGAVGNVSAYLMLNKKDKTATTEEVSVCRSYELDVHSECIKGLAVGIVQSAAPTREFELAKVLCTTKDFTDTEKAACYQATLQHVRPLVSDISFKASCSDVPEEYRGSYCSL